MTIIRDQKPSLSTLEHHGVKGMKWGVRTGGFQSRVQGAVDDSMQRRIATATAVASGNAQFRDKWRSTVYTGAGFTQSKKLAARRVRVLTDRQNRINKGEAKATDVLAQVGHIKVADLVVSRRDLRGP